MREQEEHRGRAAARQLQVPHPSQNVVADMALARFNGRTRTPWELAEEADRQAALEQQVLGLGQFLSVHCFASDPNSHSHHMQDGHAERANSGHPGQLLGVSK